MDSKLKNKKFPMEEDVSMPGISSKNELLAFRQESGAVYSVSAGTSLD